VSSTTREAIPVSRPDTNGTPLADTRTPDGFEYHRHPNHERGGTDGHRSFVNGVGNPNKSFFFASHQRDHARRGVLEHTAFKTGSRAKAGKAVYLSQRGLGFHKVYDLTKLACLNVTDFQSYFIVDK
jgi:hypothetical protein